jgi:DNA polymerase III alpha subunit
MKDLIKRLKPDCFEDMIALVALFRLVLCSQAW